MLAPSCLLVFFATKNPAGGVDSVPWPAPRRATCWALSSKVALLSYCLVLVFYIVRRLLFRSFLRIVVRNNGFRGQMLVVKSPKKQNRPTSSGRPSMPLPCWNLGRYFAAHTSRSLHHLDKKHMTARGSRNKRLRSPPFCHPDASSEQRHHPRHNSQLIRLQPHRGTHYHHHLPSFPHLHSALLPPSDANH
jgi:hypothetical protein